MLAKNYWKIDDKIYNKVLKIRTNFFRPLIKLLDFLKITANHISLIGVLLLIGFFVYAGVRPDLAVIFLVLHVLMDALDGVLARYQGTSGTKGEFIDTVADYTGLFIITFTLAYVGLVEELLAMIYIFLYFIMVVFMIVRYLLNVRADVIVRTKYLIYALYVVWAYTNINFIDDAVLLASAAMIITNVIGFIRIKKALAKKDIKLKSF